MKKYNPEYLESGDLSEINSSILFTLIIILILWIAAVQMDVPAALRAALILIVYNC